MNNAIKLIILIGIISFFQCSNIYSQIGRLALSPTQKTIQTIGLTDITIEYSRPSMRGRTIFGDLVPYGKYWRTGANRNTTIEISEDFFIDNKKVKKGKYAIFTVPKQNEWEILLYNDTDNWDVPEEIDVHKIVAHAVVNPEKMVQKKEVFTVSVGDFTNYEFDLTISWENTIVTLPIGLDTREMMDEKIKRNLSGPGYEDYYLAAVYEMESGMDYEQGLEWIIKARELKDGGTWWDIRVQSILLMNLGRTAEAKELAEEGLILAKEDKREYGINEFERILREIK